MIVDSILSDCVVIDNSKPPFSFSGGKIAADSSAVSAAIEEASRGCVRKQRTVGGVQKRWEPITTHILQKTLRMKKRRENARMFGEMVPSETPCCGSGA